MVQDNFRDKTSIFNQATGSEVDDPFAEVDTRRKDQDEAERKLAAGDYAAVMREAESDGNPSYSRILPYKIKRKSKRSKEDEALFNLLIAQFEQWYKDVTARLDARLALIDQRLHDLGELELLVSNNALDLNNSDHGAFVENAGLTHAELETDPADAVSRRRQELWNQRDAVEAIKFDLERDIDKVSSESDLEDIMRNYDTRIQLTFAAQDAQNQPAAHSGAEESILDRDNQETPDPENALNAFFPGQGR